MSETKANHPFPVESATWTVMDEGKFASRYRVLSDTRRAERPMKIGVAMEELPPGKQSCPFHFHMLEEEHILMLAGEVTLRLGEERITMKTGDFVSFRAGDPVGHCLVNEGTESCRYLVIGDNQKDEVCVYPDSNKVMVRALSRIPRDDIFDGAATKDYFDGER